MGLLRRRHCRGEGHLHHRHRQRGRAAGDGQAFRRRPCGQHGRLSHPGGAGEGRQATSPADAAPTWLSRSLAWPPPWRRASITWRPWAASVIIGTNTFAAQATLSPGYITRKSLRSLAWPAICRSISTNPSSSWTNSSTSIPSGNFPPPLLGLDALEEGSVHGG